MKSTLKWKRANTIYPSDHIVSSKAREVNACWGFRPEYENEKHVNMRFLMSNEYMRLWFKERVLYQKENYSKQENAQNDSKLQRGYVQRMMINPKQQSRELPIIRLKRFQNIISKIDNGRTVDEKTKICERYKNTISPEQMQRYKPACAPKQKMNIGAQHKKQKKEMKQESPARQDPTIDDAGDCQFVCKLIN